jgi:tetratricopeptide (TPR) repeat protein
MKIFNIIFFLVSFIAPIQITEKKNNIKDIIQDSSHVILLNNQAFKARLINPELTISNANKALKIAKKIGYTKGIAESYRVIGVGNSYKNAIDTAIENYLNALTYFKKCNDLEGQAKVYNNIGNLYRDIDNNKSLDNFNKSLNIAKKLKNEDLIAGLYLNIGTANQQRKDYRKALSYYKQSISMFANLNNRIGLIQSNQNMGVLYLNLGDFKKAEGHLSEALANAKDQKLNNSIAAINLTLSSIHIAQNRFEEAEKTIKEGLFYTKLLRDTKLEYNYTITSYELEKKRKNYFKALNHLQKAYKQDSIKYANNISDKISLLASQHIQLEKQKENELTIAKQKYAQILFWASSLVALLAFFVIFLLVRNVKKSTNTNKELTRLNLEISKQKDDLDKINQNLEEIISERTKDLKVKNKKLSEYSSHLSHQVRSPVASLKGLMLLEKDDLIDKEEFIEQMSICIHDLDDKIININENLNNPSKPSLINED